MTALNYYPLRIRDREIAVSEIYGMVLIIGIVIAGIALITYTGSFVISDSQDAATYNGVEQAFTMADSRISKARFGTAISQEAPLALRDGKITINDSYDNSYIKVYNIDGITTIYDQPMGTIICEMEDGVIAYQDGGVWSSDKENGSLMISPPDFDYNGVTLTLPIMRIKGSESLTASDNTQAVVSVTSSNPSVIFPDPAFGTNPIPQGKVIRVDIKSDYYQAWADYLNETTRAEAIVDKNNKLVTVYLKTGMPIHSGLASAGYSTKSMDVSNYDAPIEVFKLNLFLRNSGNDYTIQYGVPNSPQPQLYTSVSRTTGHDNKEYAYIAYEYTHENAAGDIEIESFSTMIPFARKSDESIDLDMLSHDIELTCVAAPSGWTNSWGVTQENIDQDHSIVDYDDYPDDVAVGTKKTLNDITQHYLWLMADYDQAHGNAQNGPFYDIVSNKYDGGQSTVKIGFKSSQDVKYLYITEGVLTTNLSSSR